MAGPREDHAYLAKLAEIRRRCDDAGIAYEEDPPGPVGRIGRVQMPNGRSTRPLVITAARIDKVLSVPFEAVSFIGRFDAIFSRSEGWIEAVVQSAMTFPLDVRRLAGVGWNDEVPNPILQVGSKKATLTLGEPSEILRVLVFGNPRIALRIDGLNVARHDSAQDALEKFANSLFFQIDSVRGIPVMLRGLRRHGLAHTTRVGRRDGPPRIGFPESEFDPEPMALYWYARSAVQMPLLQFLAFYQVLEFYFSKYAAAEARTRIQNTLKDPQFDPYNERDIGKVLAVAGYGAGRGGYADERSQLKATVRSCADPETVRTYVFSEKNAEFFGKKAPGLTNTLLRPVLSDDDLLEAVAQRIYDIRCKIVHTKEIGDREEVRLLLPFSPEAERLSRDLALIHLIARSALISGSRKLSFSGVR
jgi:hypothetical protein